MPLPLLTAGALMAGLLAGPAGAATAAAPPPRRTASASAAIDGRQETIWHDEFTPQAPLPQSITIDLGRAQRVDGLTYQPRLDAYTTGTITAYRVEVSTDGTTFTQVATGTWADDRSLKTATFSPASARCVRVTATAGDGGYASAAEIHIRQAAS